MEKITLSNGIETLEVEVDKGTADMLNKDAVVRAKYFEMCKGISIRNNNSSENEEMVWQSARHPTKHDEEATQELVLLRSSDKYVAMFKNKRTSFNAIWGHIAKDMTDKGFHVGSGKNGAEKCRQKFSNLQKTYIKHIEHMKSTGNDMKKPPPNFDLLNKIFGDKHKANPIHLIDSLPGSQSRDESNEVLKSPVLQSFASTEDSASSSRSSTPTSSISQSSTSDSSTNRFCNVQQSLKKPKSTEKVIDLIEKNHIEIMNHKKMYSERMLSLLEKQCEQRDKFLDIFSSLTKKKGNKRKHSSDESD